MISRQNYEIWFLDYLEGNLNSEESLQLFAFLESNFDLKEEFESFEIFTLDKEETKFKNKDRLKKNIDVEPIQGLSEFEILAIKKIEGEIDNDELKVLNHLITSSEARSREFVAFENTKLVPDRQISFAKKDNLKKRSGIVRLLYNYSASIAAAVLLVIFFSSIIYTGTDHTDNSFTGEFKKDNSDPNSLLASNDLFKAEIKPIDESKDIENAGLSLDDFKRAEHSKSMVKADKSLIVVNNAENPKEVIAESRISTFVRALNTGFSSINKIPNPEYIDYSAGRKNEIALNDIGSPVPALTPKEFLIKTVKNNLDINDKDYSRINTMDVVSAAVDKTKFANLNYSKDEATDSREFAFSIGSVSFSRKWTRE